MPAVLGAVDPAIEWSEAERNPYQPSGKAWKGPDAVVRNLTRWRWEGVPEPVVADGVQR
jgi:hypothetical protein